jgi:formylglycine-generating enzyme required for sulfatase activity
MFCRPVLVFSLLAGAVALPAAEDSATGPPLEGQDFTVAQPAIAMIWVAPGSLLMNSPHGPGDDTRVTLTRGYWLGRTEVTQEQWQAVIDYYPLPSHFKGSDRPVEKVDWDTVMLFCAKLTARERAAGRLPHDYEYTLPTEAQWEYACRAGTTGKYAGPLDALAWYEANSDGQTHPVGRKQPNAWGFYDMHGNVREWCLDWYAAYPGGSVSDPAGAEIGQFRIDRGGSWGDLAGNCRAALRHFMKPTAMGSGVGFRLALAPVRPPPADASSQP